MSRFTDTVHQDTPRLVIEYTENNGKENYKWGIVGVIPILSLIGKLEHVQTELPCVLHDDDDEFCPHMALVLTWDADYKVFSLFYHPDIPLDSLRGMIEIVKFILIMNQVQRVAASPPQGAILGPDGQPLMR